ncbi:hypothetical protein EDD18DRAFT_1110547 [Armillaria luteobubalina]|uniref:Uncharacterized protein n=1 Tax=Armillaria luteobubalina TaxID=153913 RepID=A0AA39PS03_9AGAR|nr:hypothetical protein EDD18DRAFT_1110547 [Armillaria luteobubalina]
MKALAKHVKMFSLRRLATQLQSVFRFQANRVLLKTSILTVISTTVKRARRTIRRSFRNLVNNPDLESSAFPPSYEVATRNPPPYNNMDTPVQNDINTIDTVEPAPQYNVEYSTPLEDVGMAGFSRSGLATIFEEDEDEAVE